MALHQDDIASTTLMISPPGRRSCSRMPDADSTRYDAVGVSAQE